MAIEIRLLEPSDDRSRFSSGDDDLDRYFHRFAGQNQFRHHVGVTYVAVADDRIVGFATVSVSDVDIDDLPTRSRRGLPRYPLPVLRLARLAVDADEQGQGVGRALLRFVLRLALRLRDEVGCVGVVVDAKADAASFYARYGLFALALLEGELGDRPSPQTMFLPIQRISTE